MNDLSILLKGITQEIICIGEIRAFSGATPPQRWRICNGDVINRQTYSKLFSTLGTTYGGGDGETTFAIPDARGRTIVGVGESSANGHTNHILGEMNGEETHTLLSAEMASHNHNPHGHGYQDNDNTSGCQPLSKRYFANDPWSGQYTGNAGSNSPHNTMQPFSTCNYIIYTGVTEN